MSVSVSMNEPNTLDESAAVPTTDPVRAFFERFPSFVYDPEEPPARQFDRLSREMDLAARSPAHQVALRDLFTALMQDFDPSYKDTTPLVGFGRGRNVQAPTSSATSAMSDALPANTKKSRRRKRGAPEAKVEPAVERLAEPTVEPIAETTVEPTAEPPVESIAECSFEPVTEEPPSEAIAQGRTLEHIDIFFSAYPGFERDPAQSVATQIGLLRKRERWWGDRQHLWGTALWEYHAALVLQFNACYGTNENDLATWHRVLARIPVPKLPETVNKCKSLIDAIHVNIVDLIDVSVESDERQVPIFESVQALSSYTHETRRFFPRRHAYAGGLLKHFLRRIA